MITIESSGKKTANLVTDVMIAREKGKDNRIIVDYPVLFLWTGRVVYNPKKNLKGRTRETFETSNIDKIMTLYQDMQEMAEKAKKAGMGKPKESEVRSALNAFLSY